MSVSPEDFRDFTTRYLDRPWSPHDGLSREELHSTLTDLGAPLPASLQAFYQALGCCEELLRMDAEILTAAHLEIDGGFLVFAHENQSVVSWGFRVCDLGHDDPHVWQRNNTDERWYDEGLALWPFLGELFDAVTETS